MGHKKQSIDFETLYLKGIHGIAHSYRVLLIARKLANLEHLPSFQKELLEFCAIFHDIGREGDGVDYIHGQESIYILKKNHFFGANRFDLQLTRYIIENHCINDKTAFQIADKYNLPDEAEGIYMLKLFKDSDNLDRFRLGDFNPDYLRIENSHQLIQFAKDLNSKRFYTSEIVKEFDMFIKNVSTH